MRWALPAGRATAASLRKLATLLTRRDVLIEEDEGSGYMTDRDAESDDARTLGPLQAAAWSYRIAFGPRGGLA